MDALECPEGEDAPGDSGRQDVDPAGHQEQDAHHLRTENPEEGVAVEPSLTIAWMRQL